jgi:hypothetical protein
MKFEEAKTEKPLEENDTIREIKINSYRTFRESLPHRNLAGTKSISNLPTLHSKTSDPKFLGEKNAYSSLV